MTWPFRAARRALLKALLVYEKAALFSHVACDFKRQSKRVIELERFRARHNLIFQRGQHTIEPRQPQVERALEALLFVGNGSQDIITARHQLGKVLPHRLDDGIGHARQERPGEADFAPKARGAAQNHAEHITAPHVARQNAVADEKCHRTSMVGDDAIGHDVLFDLRVVCPSISCVRRMSGMNKSVL